MPAKKTKRVGRPPGPRGVGNKLPTFTVGRLEPKDAATIMKAIKRSGETRTAWCREALLVKAMAGKS